MKKIVLLFAMAVIFTACSKPTTEATTVDSIIVPSDTATVTVDSVTTVTTDSVKK